MGNVRSVCQLKKVSLVRDCCGSDGTTKRRWGKAIEFAVAESDVPGKPCSLSQLVSTSILLILSVLL